jgi:ATP-dependent protease ClpP protease subunit
MKNFVISNKSESTTEIDIFGDIGEDWWTGEGNTLESVLADLRSVNTPNITLNISSLGGDVNHALGIHDAIKMHPAKVTAKITGFTASSGTIVSMAADDVQMSDNSLFLVHNAWTVSVGNQHDMREMAEDLERVDNRIINIYEKKSGKTTEEISDLMKEEKWISAEEAKEFGFIDTVFEPVAMAASIDKIINSKNLPEVPKSILNKIENMNYKEEFDAFKESVNNKIEAIVASVAGKTDANAEVTVLDNEEVTELVEGFENKVSEMVDSLQSANDSVEAKDAEIATLSAKVSELEATVAQNAEGATTVEPVDGNIEGTEEKLSEWSVLANKLKKDLR